MKYIFGLALSLLMFVGTASADFPKQGLRHLLYCGGFAANASAQALGKKSTLNETLQWARANRFSTSKWNVPIMAKYLRHKGLKHVRSVPANSELHVGDILLLPRIPLVIGHYVTVMQVLNGNEVLIYDSTVPQESPFVVVKNNIPRNAILRAE